MGALWYFKGNPAVTFYRRQFLIQLFLQSCDSSPLVMEEIINHFTTQVSYQQKMTPCISWGFNPLFYCYTIANRMKIFQGDKNCHLLWCDGKNSLEVQTISPLRSTQWIFLISKIKLCLLWLLKNQEEKQPVNVECVYLGKDLKMRSWGHLWKCLGSQANLTGNYNLQKTKKLWQLVTFLLGSGGTLFKEKQLSNLASLYYMMFQNSLLYIQNSFL